jgi:hypothetical protein
MRRTAGVVAVFLLAGCGSSGPGPSGAETGGTVAVQGKIFAGGLILDPGETGDPCTLDGGFSDLTDGGPVTVTGPDSKVVGLGRIGAGKRSNALEDQGVKSGICVVPFTATAPTGLKFYGITVGHRNPVQVAEADLGAVEITLK